MGLRRDPLTPVRSPAELRRHGWMNEPGEVTRLLKKLTQGDTRAMDRLVPIIYGELREIAHRQLVKEKPGHTLSTTALVHEAYLKLSDLNRVEWQDRTHFFAVAARAMRRILIDYAVKRKAQKRGGERRKVSLDQVDLFDQERSDDLLALDEALRRLSELDERQGRVVECRFFAGMSIEDTAEALQVSPATVKRDWTVARAFLNRELQG